MIDIIVVLGIVCFSVRVCFGWVLGPLNLAAKDRQCAVQFGLADFFCLFVLIQLPLGAVYGALHGAASQELVIGTGLFLLVVISMIWWNFVQMLSRASIQVVWQRCVVLAVVLPLAAVGSIAMTVVAVLLVYNHGTGLRFIWFLVGEVSLACLIYGAGRFTRAIVASAAKNEEQETVENDQPQEPPQSQSE